MSRNKVLLAAVSAAALFCIPRVGYSAIISNALTFNGVEDVLVDSSVAVGVRDNDVFLGNLNQFQDGDVIFGMILVDKVERDGGAQSPFDGTLVIVFSAEVKQVSGSTYLLGPVDPATSPYDLGDLLPAGTLPASATAQLSNAIFAVLGNAGDVGLPSHDTGVGDLDGDGDVDDDVDRAISAIRKLTGPDWGYEALGGIAPASDDFFEADAVSSTTIEERGGFTILDHVLGPGVLFLPVSAAHVDSDPFHPGTPTLHDVALGLPSNISPETNTSTPWTMSDNSRFKINATPEPASVALWAMCASAGALGWYRRRRS